MCTEFIVRGSRSNKTPRPIIAKLKRFKHKELIKNRGKELEVTKYRLNNQFPHEISERRKVLYPIMKQHRQNKKHANLIVGKLYTEGQLYHDPNTTLWVSNTLHYAYPSLTVIT